MSHECALKLTDLWKTTLLLYLNYKFELIGASLLALAKSIYCVTAVCANLKISEIRRSLHYHNFKLPHSENCK